MNINVKDEWHEVWIAWGERPTANSLIGYSFASAEALDAFLTGVDAAIGWHDFTQYDTEEEAIANLPDDDP